MSTEMKRLANRSLYLKKKSSPGKSAEIPSEIVFHTPWFSVEKIPSRAEWGMGKKPFYQISGPDSVSVLPLTASDQIVLVRQYRPARGRFTLELPTGYIDHDETPEDAAKRELQEECGYVGSDYFFLGKWGYNLNRESKSHHCYVALDARRQPDITVHEKIDVVLCAARDFIHLALSEDFEDLTVLGIVALAQAHLGVRIPRFY